MRGLFFLALILLIVAAVYGIYWLRTHKAGTTVPAGQDDEWEFVEVESNTHPITTIFLVRGTERERWQSVNRLDDDYEQQLYNACSSAQDEIDDRNMFRKALRS